MDSGDGGLTEEIAPPTKSTGSVASTALSGRLGRSKSKPKSLKN